MITFVIREKHLFIVATLFDFPLSNCQVELASVAFDLFLAIFDGSVSLEIHLSITEVLLMIRYTTLNQEKAL
jgi:hypothetical protein